MASTRLSLAIVPVIVALAGCPGEIGASFSWAPGADEDGGASVDRGRDVPDSEVAVVVGMAVRLAEKLRGVGVGVRAGVGAGGPTPQDLADAYASAGVRAHPVWQRTG